MLEVETPRKAMGGGLRAFFPIARGNDVTKIVCGVLF